MPGEDLPASYLQGQGVHEDIVQELHIWMIWLQALAQHYGSGSSYLDVTHDLAMAVWFAFHQSRMLTLKSVVGAHQNSEQDATLETESEGQDRPCRPERSCCMGIAGQTIAPTKA